MNILDIIVIVGIFLGLLWGARKGLIGIIILVLGIVVTIVLVNSFGIPFGEFLKSLGVNKDYSYPLSVFLILLISFLVFFIVHLLLKTVIDIFRIGVVNRVLGALLGAWILFVLIGSIFFFAVRIPLVNLKHPLKESILAKYSFIHAKNVMSLSGTEEVITSFIEGKD